MKGSTTGIGSGSQTSGGLTKKFNTASGGSGGSGGAGSSGARSSSGGGGYSGGGGLGGGPKKGKLTRQFNEAANPPAKVDGSQQPYPRPRPRAGDPFGDVALAAEKKEGLTGAQKRAKEIERKAKAPKSPAP